MKFSRKLYNQVNVTALILLVALFSVSMVYHWWWLVALSVLCGFSMLSFCQAVEAG